MVHVLPKIITDRADFYKRQDHEIHKASFCQLLETNGFGKYRDDPR